MKLDLWVYSIEMSVIKTSKNLGTNAGNVMVNGLFKYLWVKVVGCIPRYQKGYS